MKKLVVALAAAVVVLAGVAAYQSIPEGKSAPKHSAAYLRIEKMLKALQTGNYKAACDVLAWYSANQFVTDVQCAKIMEASFKGSKLQYKMGGEVRGAARYRVVTVLMAQDNPDTKINESAECAKAWADGKDCKYNGVYTFGVVLSPSVEDALSSAKGKPLHWYVNWID
jgi:hypothetical protein